MNRKAIIQIATTQVNNLSNEEETIELITEGDFYEEEGSFRLVYDETEISGLKGTTTTLNVQGEKVVMSRSGNASSIMEFEKGKKHKTVYDTEFGSMYMEMSTTKVDVSLKKDPLSIDIRIDYDIIVKNMFEGKNRMYIKVKQ
ncbi:MAG: DUF1934 domain-containing protein [Peptostreptococcaceae bacterium]|nr:DUF1934 domain-containing protein [Peptostreptococcaceae bacterium]